MPEPTDDEEKDKPKSEGPSLAWRIAGLAGGIVAGGLLLDAIRGRRAERRRFEALLEDE